MKRKKHVILNEKGELCGTAKVKRETQVSKPGIGMDVPFGRIQYGMASRRYRHGSKSRRS